MPKKKEVKEFFADDPNVHCLNVDGEVVRVYVYRDGNYQINGAKKVYVKKRPGMVDSHRVLDAQGISHYPRPGWLGIQWKSEPAFIDG